MTGSKFAVKENFMAKNRSDENAVNYAIRQVCGLYGVELLRMQSRVFTVRGAAGKDRPMFFGQWTDQFANLHSSGMADWLARPKVQIGALLNAGVTKFPDSLVRAIYVERVTIPLWIESKTEKGKLSHDQVAFKSYVESNGEHWICVKESFDELIEWFEKHGVKK